MRGMKIALAAAAAVVLLTGCGGSSKASPHDEAMTYISKHGDDMKHVQSDVLGVQTAIADVTASSTAESVQALADAAQAAHDDLSDGKDGFADMGSGSDVGQAVLDVYTAVNDLKNSMGGIVAFTVSPDTATEAKMTSQYGTAVAEWNSDVTTLWTAAGLTGAPTIG